MTRNDDYWQEGLPYLDAVEFRVIPDNTSRGASLQSGEIDAMEVTTAPQLAEFIAIAEDGEVQLYTDAGRETDEVIITLNTTAPPFDDPLARLAVAIAVDRPTLSEAATEGMFPRHGDRTPRGRPPTSHPTMPASPTSTQRPRVLSPVSMRRRTANHSPSPSSCHPTPL